MCRKPMVPGFFRTTREELRVIVSFFWEWLVYVLQYLQIEYPSLESILVGTRNQPKIGFDALQIEKRFSFLSNFGIYILANMKKRSVNLDFETPVLHGISKVRNPGRHWYLFYNLCGTECYYQCSLFSILDHQSYCRMLHILAQGL